MAQNPFPEIYQLNSQLRYDRSEVTAKLCRIEHDCKTLPGQPRIRLDSPELDDYPGNNLLLPQLNRLAPKLWLVCFNPLLRGQPCSLGLTNFYKVSTPRSSHISPLHHQAVRRRSIVLTESPQLHLVWYYNEIFIKPIPRYMLSFAFWEYLATQPAALRQAAVGFMRTYSYLVRYEMDFSIAQERGLIPSFTSTVDQANAISWDDFARLISSFDKFGDEAVSPRYSYGELRLTRLNFYSRIFLGKLTFHHVSPQWGALLSSAVAPLIVVFVIVSAILNAMQVALVVQGTSNIEPSWAKFAKVSQWFSVLVLVFAMIMILFLFVLIVLLFVHDILFTRRIIKGKKKDPDSKLWKSMKCGVV